MAAVIDRPTGVETLRYLIEVIAAGQALAAAEELGVLARLSESPADAATISRECGVDERGTGLLLSALAGTGLLRPGADGAYELVLEARLVERLRSFWASLPAALRDGRPVVAGDTAAGAQRLYPDTVGAIAQLSSTAAGMAADYLAPLAQPAPLVLDVGAGSAGWSLALVECCPDARVVAFDLPAVLETTRRAVAAAGREARYTFQAGDLFATNLGGDYDLAIAGNLYHLFPADRNVELTARLFASLKPGGRLAIVDTVPNEALDGPRPAVLYALGLALRSTRGRIYPFSTYVRWLRGGGFVEVEPIDRDGGSHLTLITARKAT
jgi:SAM-dependent methyltransferase